MRRISIFRLLFVFADAKEKRDEVTPNKVIALLLKYIAQRLQTMNAGIDVRAIMLIPYHMTFLRMKPSLFSVMMTLSQTHLDAYLYSNCLRLTAPP